MRWLRRVWEGLRRVLRGGAWDASPPSPREAAIEAEIAELEERVRRLMAEVRGAAGTATEGKVVQTEEKSMGGERELRKASQERDDVSETASYPPAPFLKEGGERQWQGESCSPAPLLGDSNGDVGEEPRVALRGVPQGICGQTTGRAGGARFWEGVL